MFGSDILDVAIGMVFIYLLLSLICSALNELLEARLKNRAADLERGVRELLHDPQGTGLAAKLYRHALVYGLFQGDYDPAQIRDGRYTGGNLPSYIPARTFALALMDLVLPARAAKDGEAAVTSGASGATPGLAAGQPGATNALRQAIGTLGNPPLEQALMTLVDAAGNDIAQARENIEAWFNAAMDRVAGWYKRRAQYIILALGLGVAVVVNADTTDIARRLSVDSTLRKSLVAAAEQYAKQAPSDAAKPVDKIKANVEAVQGLGLPVGWYGPDLRRQWPGMPWKTSMVAWTKAWAQLIYWHWLGWLLTAFAISLGAPFWFDLLNKIIVVRSTVKPQEKSPEEKSKQ